MADQVQPQYAAMMTQQRADFADAKSEEDCKVVIGKFEQAV